MSQVTPDAKSLFLEAIDKESPQELARYLDEACQEDAELRGRVEQLLGAHQKAGKFLGGSATMSVELDPPPLARAGASIGPYKLLQQIGEGGMGVVFMAEQTAPLRRRVALKIIKPGMDTRQVIGRFEAERHALALMDHPNIAKVLDAGAVGPVCRTGPDASQESAQEGPGRQAGPTGRPYFVMELVKGVPITEYCDARQLTLRERLKLFVPVCHAVQHAHQKGIIHRDLKPNNVLVADYDERPVAKIIDFGVAKAVGQGLTEQTMFTQFGQVVGTIEYMSPEQAKLNQLDVDTRSDVYSLGVLLYELLTGSTPFDRVHLRASAFDEMLRIIREEEPPKPSTRLSTLEKGALSTVCQRRGVDARQLGQRMRGELDWIVMKCLEKDRNRRYETTTSMAQDVERYLADEPVQACPPSAVYRFGKFARRNRAALLAATLVAFVLLCGIGASTSQAVRAARAEQKAVIERDAKERARREAVASARRAKEVSDFLVSALRSPDPLRDGRTITIAEVLERSAQEVAEKFADDPITKATVLDAIGGSYHGLGLYHEAIPLREKVRELRTRELGPEHSETLRAMSFLASTYQGAGRLDEALALHEEALKLRKATLGLEHYDTLASMNNLAGAYRAVGRLDQALALHEEAVKLTKANLGPEHSDTLVSMNNLAMAYRDAGRRNEALLLHEQALDLQKSKLGPEHPHTLVSMDNVAMAYWRAGRRDVALPLLEETLKLKKVTLGAEHRETLHSMHSLAQAYGDTGRFDEALPLFEQTFKLQLAKLGPQHPETLILMNNQAAAYGKAGRWDEALPLFEQTLKLQQAKLGPEHPETLKSMNNLAISYGKAGRRDEGLSLQQEALELQKSKLGLEHPDTLLFMNNLASAYRRAGRLDKAELLFKQALEGRRKLLGENHADTATSWLHLAFFYRDGKRDPDAAVPHFRKAVAAHIAAGGEKSTGVVETLRDLAFTLHSVKQDGEVETLYRRALAAPAGAWRSPPGRADTVHRLAEFLTEIGDHGRAEPLWLELWEWIEANPDNAAFGLNTEEIAPQVAGFYRAWGKADVAEQWTKKMSKR